MATHHWIIICGIKHHVQVGDYSGMRESGPLKRYEDGDEEGDVDEDDHRGDGSPDGTPVPSRERGRGFPPCASSSMASPLGGERFSLWSFVTPQKSGCRFLCCYSFLAFASRIFSSVIWQVTQMSLVLPKHLDAFPCVCASHLLSVAPILIQALVPICWNWKSCPCDFLVSHHFFSLSSWSSQNSQKSFCPLEPQWCRNIAKPYAIFLLRH